MNDTESVRDLLVESIPLVDRVIASIGRRYALRTDEAEEIAAHVRLRLMEDDFAILRKFEGRSTLGSYLSTVVRRLFLDYRTADWGRWRPCRSACRQGDSAILLDRLMTRDGLSFDEAFEVLRTNYQITRSRDELYAMTHEFTRRVDRRATEALLDDLPARDGGTEAAALREEAITCATETKRALKAAFSSLSVEDRRILELRYRQGLRVVDIARHLGLDQRRLYRRLEGIVRSVRSRVPRRHVQPSTAHAFATADISISW